MTVRCELINHSDRNGSQLVVTDAGYERDMVMIIIEESLRNDEEKIVKVNGKELIEAVSRCLNAR